ncbi:kinase-like domain-containing protein [Boletus edulis]|nr:kinase-like domain-containing protein [Boletus edulis]
MWRVKQKVECVSRTPHALIHASPLLYTLREVLGAGSHAIVYRAQDLISGQDVAVKLEHCTQDPSSLEHEFHILKKLHGGVGFPQPLFFGRESSYRALVLSNVATPLCDILTSQGGCLNLDVVLTVGHQLVHRLEYVHSHNYIHRDIIKPQNVLIGNSISNCTVFLIDFGSLPWFSSIHPSLSNDAILKLKQDTTVDELCDGLPHEFATFLQYSRSLAYMAKPDYDYLRLLLHHCTSATGCGLFNFSGLTNDKGPSPPPHNKREDSVIPLVTTLISTGPTTRQKTYSGRGHDGSSAKKQNTFRKGA